MWRLSKDTSDNLHKTYIYQSQGVRRDCIFGLKEQKRLETPALSDNKGLGDEFCVKKTGKVINQSIKLTFNSI